MGVGWYSRGATPFLPIIWLGYVFDHITSHMCTEQVYHSANWHSKDFAATY
jgi:hypothetical protein